jgi:LAGLIDADG endonuclease
VPSGSIVKIVGGMQHAGPHSKTRDVYGVAVRLDPWFVTGLTEGEGCFCVSFVVRPTMRVGLQALPSFSLSLNEKDRELLGALQAFFECGHVRESRSDRTVKYEVRSVPELTEYIVPHFEAYPLLGAKRRSFEGLAKVCEMMWQGHHLRPEGMAEMVTLAYEMNLGKRRYPASALLPTLSEVKG